MWNSKYIFIIGKWLRTYFDTLYNLDEIYFKFYKNYRNWDKKLSSDRVKVKIVIQDGFVSLTN